LLGEASMRYRLLFIVFIIFTLPAIGQNAPAFRQFYFNPYLFNPAFAGMSDYAEVSVFYRQQWLSFNNAPSATGFTLLYPSHDRVSFGMNFITQEAVALRTTSTQGTFAYRIPITYNQFLFFGLSGVVGYNDLKLDSDFSNDPAVLNAASTKFYGDANFGLVYQLGNIQVGFALPKLFGQPYYSPSDLVNVRYSQFRNQLYSLSYKFYAGNFSFEPYALYRVNRDLQNWWEGAMLVNFREKIWAGTSYHSTQGLGFFMGMDFNEKFRFGYSYELPPASAEFVSTSSHEIHLKLRLGKKRQFKWAARFEKQYQSEVVDFELTPSNVQDTTSAAPSQTEVVLQQDVTRTEITGQPDSTKQTTVTKEVKHHSRPPVQAVFAPGHYVVAASFNSKEYARAFAKRLSDAGVSNPLIGYNSANKMQYVYVFSSYDIKECRKVRDQLRVKRVTKDVWILSIH
jgi:type IX secretion system PorP/SprF family membrane protein